MGRRALQIATVALALIPILTGIITMLGVSDPLYAASGVPALPVLDSNLRFFGGLWFGLEARAAVCRIERACCSAWSGRHLPRRHRPPAVGDRGRLPPPLRGLHRAQSARRCSSNGNIGGRRHSRRRHPPIFLLRRPAKSTPGGGRSIAVVTIKTNNGSAGEIRRDRERDVPCRARAAKPRITYLNRMVPTRNGAGPPAELTMVFRSGGPLDASAARRQPR